MNVKQSIKNVFRRKATINPGLKNVGALLEQAKVHLGNMKGTLTIVLVDVETGAPVAQSALPPVFRNNPFIPSSKCVVLAGFRCNNVSYAGVFDPKTPTLHCQQQFSVRMNPGTIERWFKGSSDFKNSGLNWLRSVMESNPEEGHYGLLADSDGGCSPEDFQAFVPSKKKLGEVPLPVEDLKGIFGSQIVAIDNARELSIPINRFYLTARQADHAEKEHGCDITNLKLERVRVPMYEVLAKGEVAIGARAKDPNVTQALKKEWGKSYHRILDILRKEEHWENAGDSVLKDGANAEVEKAIAFFVKASARHLAYLQGRGCGGDQLAESRGAFDNAISALQSLPAGYGFNPEGDETVALWTPKNIDDPQWVKGIQETGFFCRGFQYAPITVIHNFEVGETVIPRNLEEWVAPLKPALPAVS